MYWYSYVLNILFIYYYLFIIYSLFRSCCQSLSQSAQHSEKRFAKCEVWVGRLKITLGTFFATLLQLVGPNKFKLYNQFEQSFFADQELTTFSKNFYISKNGNGVIVQQ